MYCKWELLCTKVNDYGLELSENSSHALHVMTYVITYLARQILSNVGGEGICNIHMMHIAYSRLARQS